MRRRAVGSQRAAAVLLLAVGGNLAPAFAVPGRLAEVGTLVERFSGHIAFLPGPRDVADARAFPLGRWLERDGLLPHVTQLSAAQLVDPETFTPKRFPVAIYACGESYRQTVREAGDGDAALRRYLRQGGTLLVLPSGPFPFYYNEHRKAVGTSPKFGLPVAGRGVTPWPERLAGVRASSEGPPEGRTLTFRLRDDQQIVRGLPRSFPYPARGEADTRWRGIVDAPPPGARYLPIVSLHDDQGARYGEGVALIEHDSGDFKGARLAYVWCSLLTLERSRGPILAGLLHYALSRLVPPPAKVVASLTAKAPEVDGRLGDPCWGTTAPTRRFFPPLSTGDVSFPTTTARLCWTRTHLCIAFECPGQAPAADEGILIGWRAAEGEPRESVEIGGDGRTRGLPAGGVARVARGSDGWTAEASIPLAAVGVSDPRVGHSLAMQFCRRTGPGDAPALFWSPADDFATDPMGEVVLGPNPLGDDFDLYAEGADGSPHWRVSSGDWRIEDGTFVGQNTGSDGYLAEGAAFGDASWRNHDLTLRFKVESYADNWRDGPRVGFRCDDAGNGYHINFTDRHIQVHKSVLGISTSDRNPAATMPWTRDREWHTLIVRAVANTFSVALDGRTQLAFRDDMLLGVPSHRTGGISLSARKWTKAKGDMIVRFDDVRVTPLSERKRWSFE